MIDRDRVSGKAKAYLFIWSGGENEEDIWRLGKLILSLQRKSASTVW